MSQTSDTNQPLPSPPADARERQLDNALADATDALLGGQSINATAVGPELSDLLKVSRQLKTLIADDPGPSAAFRARLTRTLTEEWDKQRFRNVNRTPPIRWIAAAAALIIVIGAATIWFNSPKIPGTAVGPIPTEFYVVVAVIGAVVGLGLIIWSLTRRK